MAFNVITAITLFITVLQLPSILAQKTTTTPSTLTPMTTTPGRIDPFITGKWGNRGSNAHMCGKSLDAIHQHVAGMLSKALEALSVLDFSVNLGTGTLTIKPPRVTEAGYARADYDLLPPKRIRSSFRDGRLVAKGVWQFKPVVGNLIGGTYIATVKDMELNATNQLGRTGDGKPIMQTIECKSHVGQYRIEIQGATDIKVVENCNWDVCHRVRKYFEDAICKLFDRFVKEVVNRELQSYPNKVTVYSELHKVDYSIMNNEPIVTDECIEFGMEGKYIWRGSSNVNFNPTAMQWVNRNRMLSFELSDYTFNTLLHQAHAQGHKFSAADLIETSPNFDQWLSLNNTGRVPGGSSKHRVQSKKTKGNKQEYAAPIEFWVNCSRISPTSARTAATTPVTSSTRRLVNAAVGSSFNRTSSAISTAATAFWNSTVHRVKAAIVNCWLVSTFECCVASSHRRWKRPTSPAPSRSSISNSPNSHRINV
jgi:hypothetical protein